MGDFWSIFFEEEKDGASFPFGDAAPGGASSRRRDGAPPSAIRFDDRFMFWALRNLPIGDAPKHFLVCGTVGSGKTILINLFLQSVAERFQADRDPPEQLIIFDAKCDIVPTLAALGYHPNHPNVWVMNPFDKRSAVWNLAEAVQEPAMARYLATLLVPEERRSNAPYFTDAAREILYAVIVALNTRWKSRWTFRDLLCALDSSEHIQGVVKHDSHAERHARQFINDTEHFHSVLSSLATKLGPFTQVASLWHTRGQAKAFSVKEFLRQPGVLILGYDPVLNDSLWPMNALLLKALTNEILRGPDTRQPRHWFVLDEFRAMQRVECMVDLLNRGRSKGASVLLGLQSVEGMVELYGESGANEILGLCGHKTFVRAGGPQTATWASDFFNNVRTTEQVISEQWGTTGCSTTVQYQVQDRPLFLPSMFTGLPYPEKGTLVAINDVPALNAATIAERPFAQIKSWLIEPTADDAIRPRENITDQKIKPWTEAEEDSFCGGEKPVTKATGNPSKTKKAPKLPERENIEKPGRRMRKG